MGTRRTAAVHHRLVAVSSQVVEQTLNHHLVTFFAEKVAFLCTSPFKKNGK